MTINDKLILVTGGSGFIGTNLVEYFLNKNYNVINIDKCSYSSVPEKFKKYNRNKKYKFIKMNLTNENKLIQVLNKYKPNLIFNLAAESHVDRSIDYPKEFIKNNINSSVVLIEIIRKLLFKKQLNNIKIVHLSTDEVYGSNVGNPSKEINVLEPNSPYSSSKASIDHIYLSYYKTYKIPILIARCCNNFGPYQFPEKFIPTIIFNSLQNKQIPIYGKGSNIREWIYVKDTCSALERVMKKGKIGEIYNIGTGTAINNKNLAIKIYYKLKKRMNLKKLLNPIKYVTDRPAHDIKYSLNCVKLKKLNWKKKYNFDLALNNTINWYISNKLWVKSCNKKYTGQRLGLKNKL